RHEQLECAPHSHESWESLRSAIAWANPELHFGLTEPGGFAGDPNVAGHRKLAAASERKAVHRRDYRLGRRLESPEDLLAADRALFGLQRSLRRELADVRTGNEGASGAGEDHAAYVLSLAHLVDCIAELTDRGGVQRVELVGAIHRDRGDTVGDGQLDRSV